MLDFHRSSVTRGIGKVVREPTTICKLPGFLGDIATYLPYVEVCDNYEFEGTLWEIILDEEKVLVWVDSESVSRVELTKY